MPRKLDIVQQAMALGEEATGEKLNPPLNAEALARRKASSEVKRDSKAAKKDPAARNEEPEPVRLLKSKNYTAKEVAEKLGVQTDSIEAAKKRAAAKKLAPKA